MEKTNFKADFLFFKIIKFGYTCIWVNKLLSLFRGNWIEIKIVYVHIHVIGRTHVIVFLTAYFECKQFLYVFVFYFKGIPEFDNLQNLVDVLTTFIYICSVEHSATNFPQYDQYAFPPNFAATLHGHPDDAAVVHVF